MSAFPELQPLKPGDTLWYVPESRRATGVYGEPRQVTVTKVGRKWAAVDDPQKSINRIDAEHLHADGKGYSSPGQCYRSRKDYEAAEEGRCAWAELRQQLHRNITPPEGVTAQRVRLAMGLLLMGDDTDPLHALQMSRDAMKRVLPQAQGALPRQDLEYALSLCERLGIKDLT